MAYSQPMVAVSTASAQMIVNVVPRVIRSVRGSLLLAIVTLGSSDCKVGISRITPGKCPIIGPLAWAAFKGIKIVEVAWIDLACTARPYASAHLGRNMSPRYDRTPAMESLLVE